MSRAERLLMQLIFLYTCAEGLVTGILYPSKWPYLYKDVAILAVYALILLRRPGRLLMPSATLRHVVPPILLFAFVTLVYLLLPGESLLGGLVALKQRLFYIPLLGIGYLFVRREQDLERLFAFLACYAIVVAAFGIFLHFAGPGSLRDVGNYYAVEERTPVTEGSSATYWRVPGTFNSPGQYSAYLLFNGLTAMSLIITRAAPTAYRRLAAVALPMIVLAMLASGARAPLILLSACVALVLLARRRVAPVVGIAVAAYAVLAFGFSFLGPGVSDRFASIVSHEHVERFQRTYFGQPFLPSLLERPLGSGLGVATIGARHFSEFKEVLLVESYLGIVGLETGVLGLAAFLWGAMAIGVLVLRLRRVVQGTPAAPLWYGLAAYVGLSLFTLPVSTGIDHAPSNLYFWFSIGALVRLADLARGRPSDPDPAGRARTAVLARTPPGP